MIILLWYENENDTGLGVIIRIILEPYAHLDEFVVRCIDFGRG